jgi:hypothetical protein
MSKKIGAHITCPNCGNVFPTELYRTIWIEYPDNRAMIFDNKINVVTCPKCNHVEKLEFPFLCTNVKKKLAVWYEPFPDHDVDRDVAEFCKHMGLNSFYAKAPRVADWEEFKRTIVNLEAISEHAIGNDVEISNEMNQTIREFVNDVKKDASKDKKKTRWWPF